MKTDYFIIGLVFLFIIATSITGKKMDSNMPMLPTIAYEKYDDHQQTTDRIHSISIGENEIKYISELKISTANGPINKIYNTPYITSQKGCTIIDSNNWKCEGMYGHEMVNGTLRSRYGDTKYKKIIYIFSIPFLISK